MSIAEHALFASKEDKENARENLIALQKQLKEAQNDDETRDKAIKVVAGVGIVGFLAWWIFGKKGDGSGGKDGTPYDGSAGNILVILASDGLFHLGTVDSTQTLTTDQLIASAKRQNATVHVTVTGATTQGKIRAAAMLINRSNVKTFWGDGQGNPVNPLS